LTLSKAVGAELYIFDWERRGAWRYPLSLLATAKQLIRRPGIVFVQNPSMVLAVFAAALKNLLGHKLIVDRHSNFAFPGDSRGPLARRVSNWMSEFSIRRADVTIVTNNELVQEFVAGRGRAFVLPDPFPEIPARAPIERANPRPFEILFVSSWQTDEPIREMIETCRILGDDVRVYVSGRPKPGFQSLLARRPENFVPTGFLTDDNYFDLMASVDAVMAVSTRPATLCCGAYEGATMGKPLILGDSSATRAYFSAGAVYTSATVDDLVLKIRLLINNHASLTSDVRAFHARASVEWPKRLAALDELIESL